MMGPLGLLNPQPGVSYLFQGDSGLLEPHGGSQHPSNPSVNQVDTTPDMNIASSLWGIAHASLNASGLTGPPGSMMHGSALGSPPLSNWTAAMSEMFLKIDSKLKVRLDLSQTDG